MRPIVAMPIRFWAKVNKQGPVMAASGMKTRCWEWTGTLRPDGYGVIGLGRSDEGIDRVHRVSWRMRRGEIPRGLFVLHRCDNPKCVRVGHLFLGTQLDNVKDCIAKGRKTSPPVRCGEENNKAKLTRVQFAEMQSLLGVETDAVIAERYGVRRSTIRRHRANAGIPAVRGVRRGDGGNAKLTRKQVDMIRSRRPGVTVRALAQAFGVSVHAIYNVISGKTWGGL